MTFCYFIPFKRLTTPPVSSSPLVLLLCDSAQGTKSVGHRRRATGGGPLCRAFASGCVFGQTVWKSAAA